MVRSLLDSSSLQESRSLRFTILLVGVALVLASGPLWVGIADRDYRFSATGERENLPPAVEQAAIPYGQLSPENQRTVDAALAGESFRFEDGTKQLPRYVSRGNTYYEFDSRQVIDWTSPASFGPIPLGIFGVWFVIEVIQHERKSLGPFGH